MRFAWTSAVLLLMVAACGSGGGGGSSASTGGVSGNGASSGGSGGTSAGGTAGGGAGGAGGVGGAGNGGTAAGGAGGASSGGAGAVIQGGACTDPIAPPASPPCAQGEPKQSYCNVANPSELVMATCESFGKSQCEASEACGSGWHFCSGSEYLARGGRTIPKDAGIIYAWVAACVRDATGNQLKDGPCSVCDTEVGMPPGMIYGCQGETISPGMIDDTIGAMADTTCHRIGENIPANSGYWSINWSGHLAGHTLCCIDGV